MEKMMRQMTDAVGEFCAGTAEVLAKSVRTAQDDLKDTKMLRLGLNEGPLSVMIDGYLRTADEMPDVLRRSVDKLREDDDTSGDDDK